MSKEDLKAAFGKFNEKHTFEPGQVIEWKPGMKHKLADGPFVVMEVLQEPIIDSDLNAGSAYYREPLDMILGFYTDAGDFLICHYDLRRMQPAD